MNKSVLSDTLFRNSFGKACFRLPTLITLQQVENHKMLTIDIFIPTIDYIIQQLVHDFADEYNV